MSPWDAASAAIDAAFGEDILYTGAGLPAVKTISVIWSNEAAGSFEGEGSTARVISCEIRYADLPRRPAKADRIGRGGSLWGPIDVADRDDIAKWVVTLENKGAVV